MKFTDYFAIYVTAPNEEGSMKYFEIIETCEDCPFNSKCENQDKCRG